MEKIVLLGCGGHAKSVVDTIEAQGIYKIVGFTDPDSGFSYRNYTVLGSDDDLESIYAQGVSNAFVCVGFLGEGRLRNKLFDKLSAIGYNLPAIIDPSAAVALDAVIGDGVFVGKNAIINAASTVGKMSIINSSAILEHDCVVGEFSHISIGAILCGAVTVGANSFIGANATVIQGKKIGSSVIVGAGSTVLTDLSDGRKAVGLVNN